MTQYPLGMKESEYRGQQWDPENVFVPYTVATDQDRADLVEMISVIEPGDILRVREGAFFYRESVTWFYGFATVLNNNGAIELTVQYDAQSNSIQSRDRFTLEEALAQYMWEIEAFDVFYGTKYFQDPTTDGHYPFVGNEIILRKWYRALLQYKKYVSRPVSSREMEWALEAMAGQP